MQIYGSENYFALLTLSLGKRHHLRAWGTWRARPLAHHLARPGADTTSAHGRPVVARPRWVAAGRAAEGPRAGGSGRSSGVALRWTTGRIPGSNRHALRL
jgi:hypothetical protein